MIIQNTLRLDKLTVRNFRCFGECSIGFHPDLTVLVADNGFGKSAILDAISCALAPFVQSVSGIAQERRIESTDVHLIFAAGSEEMTPAGPAEISVTADVDGNRAISWRRRRMTPGSGGRTTSAGAQRMRAIANALRLRVEKQPPGGQNPPSILPLVAYYGTERLAGDWLPDRHASRWSSSGRLSAYAQGIASTASFNEFVEWFEETWSALNKMPASASREGLDFGGHIQSIERATQTVLRPTGWRGLDWDPTSRRIVVHHPERGRLQLRMLSDGVRNMIALVADLAHRCVRLNPYLGERAPVETPGVVLIDEVDLHLHPSWQQSIIELLRTAFPLLQFIITTHSHLVVSTVPSESVRMIEADGTVRQPAAQVQGADSPFALSLVFDVNSTPPIPVARDLSRYRTLIEQGAAESPEALTLREQLIRHFGEQHPAIAATRSLLRIQKLKAIRPPAEV